MRECEWVDHQSVRGTSKTDLGQAGPIDLAVDAWKLAATASKWAETDLRTPASQELSLLWVVPRSEYDQQIHTLAHFRIL